MSFYDATVPAYLQILNSLSGLLTKAEAHCEAKKIQPDVLLASRLYPDMLPLSKQIQLASDFAARGCARVTHSEVPSTPDTEKTFAELKAAARQDHRLRQVVQARAVRRRRHQGRHLPDRPDKTMTLKGQQFLSSFAFPNFYFHAAIAHGILRHNGVEVGKRDFLGVELIGTVIPGCALLGAGPESTTSIASIDSPMCNRTSELSLRDPRNDEQGRLRARSAARAPAGRSPMLRCS